MSIARLNKFQLLDDCWVPISWDENGIVVLTDNPSDSEKRTIICAAMDTRKIIYSVGIKEDIEAFINRFFDEIEINDLILELDAGKRPGDVKYAVNILLTDACRQKATEIYFEPSDIPGKITVLFRMDEDNLEYITVSDEAADDILKRIKSMAKLDTEDNRLPKIGHILFRRDGLKGFLITVNTYPTGEYGELVALKIRPVEETIGLDKSSPGILIDNSNLGAE